MTANAPASIAASRDDVLTVCAIGVLAFMLSDVIHEGLGHALLAFWLGAQSGVVSTVAWSSQFDSKLVAAGGTLANLAAAGLSWLLLKSAQKALPALRYFWLLLFAFNLFNGTGYFFFSGVSGYGDWAAVIEGLRAHALWRTMLVVVGILAYFGAVVAIGTGLVRYVGVALEDIPRFRRLTFWPYISAIAVNTLAGLLNPVGLRLVLLSSLPATAGANCGLLWMRYYISKSTAPHSDSRPIVRSWVWISVSLVLALAFIFVLGRGIPVHR